MLRTNVVGTTSPPGSGAEVPPESLLVRYVKAHVRQGEKSKQRADHAREKADQHFIAAGQYLITLKANYSRTWEEWETLIKTKVRLSTGRASELMQMADGRKDLQQIRDATTQRVRALRARGSSLQGQSNEEDIPDDQPVGPESERATAGLGARSHAFGQRAAPDDNKGDPNRLIDALAESDAKTRGTAAEALISGSRQAQFEPVTNAVADLYQRLARAGR